MPPLPQQKRVLIFAGANGSGKSTLIANNYKFTPSNYICPDNLLNPDILDETERMIDAMNHAAQLRKKALETGESFVFETVFSTPEKLEFLKECKRNGYEICTIYVTTCDPSINLGRIEERVKQGGHDVPKDKVVSRYFKSLGFLKDIILLSDSVEVYDNSFEEPFCVFVKQDDGRMYLLNKERQKEWVYNYIEKYFSDNIDYGFT